MAPVNADKIRAELKRLVVQYTDLPSSASRCKAILTDLFPANKKEVRALVIGVEELIPATLLSCPVREIALRQAESTLTDGGLEAGLAAWVAQTWAYAVLPAEPPKGLDEMGIALWKLWLQHDKGLLENPEIVADGLPAIPEHTARRRALLVALDDGVVSWLMSSSQYGELTVDIAPFLKHLEEDSGLSRQMAYYALHSWARVTRTEGSAKPVEAVPQKNPQPQPAKSIHRSAGNLEHVVMRIKAHDNPLTALAFYGDDEVLLSTAMDGKVTFWDVSDGSLLHSSVAHTLGAHCVCFNEYSQTIVTGGADGKIVFWRGEKVCKRIHYEGGPVNAVACNPMGIIAAGHASGEITLWDSQYRRLAVLNNHSHSVTSLDFNSDQYLASGSRDREVMLWDIGAAIVKGSVSPIAVHRGHSESVTSVVFSRAGLLASAGREGSISIYHPALIRCDTPGVSVTSLAFHPTLRVLSSGHDDKRICHWDTTTGALLGKVRNEEEVNAICFSHNGQLMASAGRDGVIVIRSCADMITAPEAPSTPSAEQVW